MAQRNETGKITAAENEKTIAPAPALHRLPEEVCSGECSALYRQGEDSQAYALLGARSETREEGDGYVFRFWAPEATAVSVVGNFNHWERKAHPMTRISPELWERFIPGLWEEDAYLLVVRTADGQWVEKSDPYAFYTEHRPKTAGRLYELDGYVWGDEDWMSRREAQRGGPMNIYELHLGSWRRTPDNHELSYWDLADLAIPYIRDMGYTHIELLPVMEQSPDAVWSYQAAGFFAPTSRCGEPRELMRFVDKAHQAGLGVFLDWAPVGYEGELECGETRSFLLSSALFWLDKYHVDGLRLSRLDELLYLDYGRESFTPNVHGGRENLEALAFLRTLNERVKARFPHTLMMAEENAGWPMVTKPTYLGGLGFDGKWNTVWRGDTLHYMSLDPIFRQFNHNDLTFSLRYAFSESYILPLSHDTVAQGKRSLMEKLPGYYPDRFAGTRAYLSFMMAHPGQKLTFMGIEIGQFAEWNPEQSLDWHLLDYDMHRRLQHYIRTLNHFYLESPELWSCDGSPSSFRWINPNEHQGNTISFLRRTQEGEEMVCLFNFSPIARDGYRLGVPAPGAYRETLNSNHTDFGGWGQINAIDPYTTDLKCNGFDQSLVLDLPPYSALFLKRVID